MSRVVPQRARGLRVDPERFEALLTRKGMEGQHLARLARCSEDAITKLRHGRRVDRDTLLRIVDVLNKLPDHPGLGALVG